MPAFVVLVEAGRLVEYVMLRIECCRFDGFVVGGFQFGGVVGGIVMTAEEETAH